MKKLLLALTLTSCACYAHVTMGKNDEYYVDSCGKSFDVSEENFENGIILFIPEASATKCRKLEAKRPIALF